MAVWKATTYKLDIAKAVFEILPCIRGKALGDRIGSYLSPAGPLVDVTAESGWEDIAFLCGWDAAFANPDVQTLVLTEYGLVERWILGGSALYQLILAVLQGNFECKATYDYTGVDRVADTVGTLITPATQVRPAAFLETWHSQVGAIAVLGRRFEDASEAFKFLRGAFREKEDEAIEIDQDKYFGDGNRLYYGHLVGNLCILRGAEHLSSRGLIFTRSHLNLLIEALARIANIYYYVASEYVGEQASANVILSMLTATITDAANARNKNADKIVQAYHKARMYAQMTIFENLHTGAIAEALAEFSKKGLHDVMDLDSYMGKVREISVNRRLDCLQVYKWMFPPDFDSTYAFSELHALHMSTRPSGADPGASGEMRELWELVVTERKRNIVAAYHAQCHEWPVWEETIACQPNNLVSWELHKMFTYHAYGADIVAQVKDKTTIPASKAKELAGMADITERSFLIWYMANAGLVATEDDAYHLTQGSFVEENYAKVAYKGEAHKPGSRLFFMAPPRQRILLGELEGNISHIAAFYPGSLQGKDAHQKAEMLQKLFDIYEDPPGVDKARDYEVFIVTFDLSKFSPRSNFNVTRDYHAFWATVFGYDAILKMGDIGTMGSIIHNQSNLVMEYQNLGADLEGFRGRLMTLFHADMLGAACRRARDLGYIVGKAVLAVFIDDGAVKIAAAGSGAKAKENANLFLGVMQTIYAAAGQENHPNKTILSKVGGELLAEQFLNGARLKCPIKAAMRLYPDYENPACAITEEFDALFAASQGAIKDQAKWGPAYRRYVVSFVKSICRWDRRATQRYDAMHLALKIITPKSYGGFGIQPFQGMASTATLNLTAEGLGMLNRAARAYPELRIAIYRIVSVSVLQRDPLAILRDPDRVRANVVTLVENRLMMAIIYKLSEPGNVASRFMAGYKAAELINQARAVADAFFARDVINIALITRAWSCTPLAYVEAVVGKFRRAKTVIDMLGYKKVGAIRAKNKTDVTLILRAA